MSTESIQQVFCPHYFPEFDIEVGYNFACKAMELIVWSFLPRSLEMLLNCKIYTHQEKENIPLICQPQICQPQSSPLSWKNCWCLKLINPKLKLILIFPKYLCSSATIHSLETCWNGRNACVRLTLLPDSDRKTINVTHASVKVDLDARTKTMDPFSVWISGWIFLIHHLAINLGSSNPVPIFRIT